ncbi:hypothetical protein O181_042032 [Austropuccinia psidii MF-1]|uniref:RNase H type-1 domain-containing protein n=1 Tax=Austropuccinia psidii MF-1 TaxID=1389203 RepID=A0A9Q3HFG3_9BASI|nr:hypothetical protein [Austropuccinia psidii MF-1]
MALLLCQELTQDHIATHGYPEAVAIFSDNQAALPKRNSTAQFIQLKLYANLQQWTEHFPVRLYWCPGHVGIPENERVDKLAKQAAESQATSLHTIHTISLSSLKRHTASTLANNPLTTEEKARIGFRTSPKLITEALDLLEKGLVATIHQLRAGHVPLNDYLHQIKRADSPMCQHCNKRETPFHYLIKCRNFNTQRQQFIKDVTKQ